MAGAPQGGAELFFERLATSFQNAGVRQRLMIKPAGGRADRLAAAGVDVTTCNYSPMLAALHRRQLAGAIAASRANVVLSWMNRATSMVPKTKVPHVARLGAMNALALISRYDLVVDGSDNFATRYLVSDACFFAGKPLVTGAVGRLDGSLTLLKPYEAGEDGTPNPTYRCLFPERPADGLLPTCAEAGVLGALTGIVGTMQAMEAIKEIVGFGEGVDDL